MARNALNKRPQLLNIYLRSRGSVKRAAGPRGGRGTRARGSCCSSAFEGPARGVSTKSSPTDLVSDADRAFERADPRAASRTNAPTTGSSPRREAARSRASGLEWVIDPLDGTVNFLFGIPVWCVSVAVEDPDGGVAGAIFDPNLDEHVHRDEGRGAHA